MFQNRGEWHSGKWIREAAFVTKHSETRQKTLQGRTMTPGKDNELQQSKMTERAEWTED